MDSTRSTASAADAAATRQGWREALCQRFLREQRRHHHATWRFIMLGWVGCIGMPAYYLVWTVWFPQEYESLSLRVAAAILCLPALWASRWQASKLVSAYLFIAVTFVLPFQFTFMYLMNHGSAVWSQSLLIALIVLFHFDTLWATASYLAGSVVAGLAFCAANDPAFLLSPLVLEQIPIYAFTIVVVSLAKVGRRVLADEKLAGMAQGLATVSHELRTPLLSVEANVRGIARRLARVADAPAAGPLDPRPLTEAIGRIQHEVRHMNHMIDLFLLSATAVNERLEADEELSMQAVVETVIRRYPFATAAQREAVRVDVRGDFNFAGRQELCVVVLLNLLRNALKALHRAGKGRIRIVVDGRREQPRLLFIDTGCGVAASQLPLIFKRFYSYPASSGAGIGLALCQEILAAWRAGIRCVSREHAYTIFVLDFPRVRPAPALHLTATATPTPCPSLSISIPA